MKLRNKNSYLTADANFVLFNICSMKELQMYTRQSQVNLDLIQCFRKRTVTAHGPELFDTQDTPQGALRMTGLGRGKPAILPVKCVHMETEQWICRILFFPREETSLTSVWKSSQHDPAASSRRYQKPSFYHRQNRKALGLGNHMGCKGQRQQVSRCKQISRTQVCWADSWVLTRNLKGTLELQIKCGYRTVERWGGPQLPAQPLSCFCKRNIVRAQKPRDGHNRWDTAGRISQEK